MNKQAKNGTRIWLFIVILLLIPAAFAAILSSEIQFIDGSTAQLLYNSNITYYADGTLVNNNVYVEICAASQSDLLNKYVSLAYKVGTNNLTLHIIPPRIVASAINATNCTDIDVDLSRSKAYYPGILSVVLSDSPDMSSPTFFDLNQTTGFLNGSYELSYTDYGAAVNVTVTRILDHSGSDITADKNYIIVGIRNSTLSVIDSEITSLNDEITLNHPGTAFDFSINGIIAQGNITNGQLNVTLDSPRNNSFLNTSNVTFICNATSNTNLNSIALYHNINGTFSANITNSSASGLFYQASFQLTNIADNSYIWNCLANSAANTTFAPANYSFTVDTTSPEVNLSLSTLTVELGVNSITIDWNASDLNLDTKYINITLPNNTQLYYSTNDSINVLLTTANFTQFGIYTVTVFANDSASNQNLTVRTFTVNDTINPSLNLSLSTNVIEYGTGNITIDWNASDLNVDTKYINITLPDNTQLYYSTNDSIDIFLSTENFTQFGYYNVTAFINDTKGNTNTTSDTFLVNDTQQPSVTLLNPQNGHFNNTGNFTLTCQAFDYSLATITLYHNMSGAGFLPNRTVAATPNSDTVSFSFNNTPDGKYIWNCLANDSNGLTQFAATNNTIIVDKTSPSVTNIMPYDGIYDDDGNITFTCNASDPYLENISLYHNMSGIWKRNQTTAASSPNSQVQFNVTNVPNGRYKWTCWANDSAGNDNFASPNRTITIDPVTPQVTLLDPPDNTYFNVPNVTVTCQAVNINLHQIVLYHDINGSFVANQSVTLAPGTTSYTAQFNLTNLPADVTFEWDCYARDNQTLELFKGFNSTIIIDQTDPVVSLISPPDNSLVRTPNVTYICNATDLHLETISLYHNMSGSWILNQTKSVSAPFAEVNFTINNTPDGYVMWNCLANDTATNDAFAPTNYTMHIDALLDIEPPEGVYEPLCCADGSTGNTATCSKSPYSSNDRNCETGSVLSGTHLHTFEITIYDINSTANDEIECHIRQSNGSILRLNSSLPALDNGEFTLNYTIANRTIDSLDRNSPWIILNCTQYNSTRTILNNPIDAILYVHNNTWTPTPGTDSFSGDDISRAFNCFNAQTGQYLNNSRECIFSGDVLYVVDQRTGALTEAYCNDSTDDNSFLGADCNDRTCSGLPFPWACPNFDANHPYVPPYTESNTYYGQGITGSFIYNLLGNNQITGNSILDIVKDIFKPHTIASSISGYVVADVGDRCTGNICTGSLGNGVSIAYTQHTSPGGTFKVRYTGSLTAGKFATLAFKDIGYPFINNQTSGSGQLTSQSHTLVPNISLSVDGTTPATLSEVLSVDLMNAAEAEYNSTISSLINAVPGQSEVETYVDANAPANNNESFVYTTITGQYPCADSIDNDLDESTDCADANCVGSVGDSANPYLPTGGLCESPESTCYDSFDNDADTNADCLDLDCNNSIGEFASGATCEFGVEGSGANYPTNCRDSFDNDADSYTDCVDQTDCWHKGGTSTNTVTNPCPAFENNSAAWCSDGIDNDNDQDYATGSSTWDASSSTGIDCKDYDCAGSASCLSNEYSGSAARCFDTLDNDLDAYVWNGTQYIETTVFGDGTDCKDIDCNGITNPANSSQTCKIQEFNISLGIQVCNNVYDDDGDDPDADSIFNNTGDTGGTDCEDFDCHQKFGHCGPCPNVENYTWNSCFNNEDDDADTTNGVNNIDCLDTDCLNELASNTGYRCTLTENSNYLCSDGVDNDGDGDTDCDDSECIAGLFGGCSAENTVATCSDNVDNDDDGYIDCLDSGCYNTGSCHPDISGDLGNCLSLPTSTTTTFSNVGITVQYTPQILNNTNYVIDISGTSGPYSNGELSMIFGVAAPGQPFPFNCSGMSTSVSTGIAVQCNVNNQIVLANTQDVNSFTAQINITPDYINDTISYYLNGGAKGQTLSETTMTYKVWEDTPPIVREIETVSSPVNITYGDTIYFRAIPNDTQSGGITDSDLCRCIFTYSSTNYTENDCIWQTQFTADGNYTIYARGVDEPGNIGDTNHTNISVDVKPTASSTGVVNRYFFNSSISAVTFSANFTTGVGDTFPSNCILRIWNNSDNVLTNSTQTKSTSGNTATCSANYDLTSYIFGERNRTESTIIYNYTYNLTYVPTGANSTVYSNTTLTSNATHIYTLNSITNTTYYYNVTYNHTIAHEDGMYFVEFNITDSDGDTIESERRTFFVCNDLNSSGNFSDGTKWSCTKADFDNDGWTEGLFTLLYYNISTTEPLACDACPNQVNTGLDRDADGIDNVCDEYCGNGVRESSNGESCDGSDFGGLTCADYGHLYGSLRCTGTCTISSALCYSGNGGGDEGPGAPPEEPPEEPPIEPPEESPEEEPIAQEIIEEIPFQPIVTCNRTVFSYTEEAALDISSYKIMDEETGKEVELALELPEGYTIAIPPFRLSCEGEAATSIQLALPDNIDDVQAVVCRDGLCGYKVMESTETVGCELPVEEKIKVVDVKQFPLDIQPLIADLSFTDVLQSNKLKVEFEEEKPNTTIEVSKAKTQIYEPANKDAQLVGAPIEIKATNKNLGKVKVEIPYVPGKEKDTLLSLYAGKVKDNSTEWEYIGGEVDKERDVIVAEIDYSQFADQSDRLILGPIGVFCPNCFSSQLTNIFTPKPDSRFAILFVHGLFSTPQTWLNVVDEIRLTNQPWQLWTYSYPTGRSVLESSDDLARRLEEASSRFDHIYIIGHSLGGMVAQRALYDAYQKNYTFVNKVRKMILVATPTEGTPLAVYLKDFINFFSNTETEGTLAVSPVLSDELIEGMITPKVPDVDYFVIAGTKNMPITQGKIEGANDGLVPLRSAQRVGDEYYDKVCENFWSRDATHNELPKDELVKTVIEQIISKSAKEQLIAAKVKAPILGYTNYFQLNLDKCDPNDQIVVFGKKVEYTETDKALICSCGNGVCAGLETPFNCPQDCELGQKEIKKTPIWLMLIIVLGIIGVLYLALAPNLLKARKKARSGLGQAMDAVKKEIEYSNKEIERMFNKYKESLKKIKKKR